MATLINSPAQLSAGLFNLFTSHNPIIMKQSVLLLLLLATVLGAGCSNDKKEIKDVAYGYIIATGNYNIDEAMPYATKETRENTLPFIKKIILPITDTTYIKANTPATATIDSIVILKDTAWVLYTKTTPLEVSTNELCVIKENGKWLVDVPLSIPDNVNFTPSDTTLSDTNNTSNQIISFGKAN